MFCRKYFVHNLLVVFLLLSAASCTVQYAKPLPDAFIISGVPYYPQEQYQCGPASLATVLNFHGMGYTPEQIASEIYSKTARGTLSIDMLLYAQRKGLKAEQYSGGMDDLRAKLRQGYPIIVMVDFGLSAYEVIHFMVATGFDSDGIVFNSGEHKSVKLFDADFLNAWKRTKYWTLWIKK